ncbi:MAG: DUF1849 family protein [Rhodospirillaceae bacterium]|nr:DUF1849 family protein [Rhodospirillaceae bacterium]
MKGLPAAVIGVVGWSATVLASGVVQAEDLEKFARKLTPHKAIYALTIKKIRVGSDIAYGDGAIYYEFRETCTSWLVKHRFKLRIIRSERSATETLFNFTSAEKKNGRRLSFSSSTSINGRVTERKSGVATFDRVGGPGVVILKKPKPQRVLLPKGTVLPTWHLLKIIRAGGRGDRTVWSNIFDGAGDNGRHNGVNVIILGSKSSPGELQRERLLRRPGWVVRVTYFEPNQEDSTPTYSLRMRLTNNGIISGMTLDYGDFAMTGKLKAIEPLNRPSC